MKLNECHGTGFSPNVWEAGDRQRPKPMQYDKQEAQRAKLTVCVKLSVQPEIDAPDRTEER